MSPDPHHPDPRHDRAVLAVRVMSVICVVLALMCAGLALAWNHQREATACWRAFAEFQLEPSGACPT